jgi:tetratricopeptide (TPR) repeat protein
LAGAQEIGKAEEAYLRALSLNDELLNAMWNLSTLYTETARTEKAVELARRMLMINPNNAQAHHSLGYVYRYAGMLEESEKEYDQALEIDPGNPRFRSAAMTYESFGKYEKALLAINLDKGSSFGLVCLARIFYRQGDNKQSIESWNKLLAQEPTGWFSFIGKAMKAVIKGEAETAKMALSELEQANPADSELWSIVAEAYGLLGDAGSSARALEEGVIRGYFNYPFMVSNSFFDRVRSAPEFQRVLEMAKVRHNNFREQFFSE